MLSKEEFKNTLNQVLESAGDPGKISELLTGLHENYNEALKEQSTLTESNSKLKESNDSLVKANGELFKYVSYAKEDPQAEQAVEVEEPKQPGIEDVMEKLVNTWGNK